MDEVYRLGPSFPREATPSGPTNKGTIMHHGSNITPSLDNSDSFVDLTIPSLVDKRSMGFGERLTHAILD